MSVGSSKEDKKVIQIERIESVTKTNEFLSKLYKEQILEVRPMENNTYLVVWAENPEQASVRGDRKWLKIIILNLM